MSDVTIVRVEDTETGEVFEHVFKTEEAATEWASEYLEADDYRAREVVLVSMRKA